MTTINNPYVPAVVFTAADMSTTVGTNGFSLVSNAINKIGYKNAGVQFSWSGTPVGTIGVSVSNSNDFTTAIALTLSGLSPALNQPAGSASVAWLDLETSAPFIWITYVKGSSTGSLNASVVVV
jgi:hypothetical protein